MVVNLGLMLGKLAAGILGRSSAMVADAVHSVSDFATDIIVLGFVGVSTRPRDETHDYGHGKFETLATVLVGVALAEVGIGIFVNAVESLVKVAQGNTLRRPGLVALIAAGASLVVKEVLFRYTRRVGTEIRSSAVIANAWHHRSDALSSVGALIGIAGAYFLGARRRILDPAAAIAVSILIAKAAVQMILPAVHELLEASLPTDTEREILDVASSVSGADDPHGLRTRRVGPNVVIEIHVCVSPDASVVESHGITKEIEDRLKSKFGDGTLITIHVEPAVIS
jgi:cation diffusion facilitator family transporter